MPNSYSSAHHFVHGLDPMALEFSVLLIFFESTSEVVDSQVLVDQTN